MKIVIAPDSFKESLTALQVGTAIETGIKRILPDARCTIVPLADGGEGTVQSLVDATGGRFIKVNVTGPLGRQIQARYGFIKHTGTAVIEMAAASGLALIRKRYRNPMRTSSYGTGELIADALRRGARRIILGLGGSATNDGGTGMAQALGVRFYDVNQRLIRRTAAGATLAQIERIDMSAVKPLLGKAELVVACDVDNPLYGRRGAAYVFGPQKGATPAMVRTLDKGLHRLADIIRRDLQIDVADVPGAGAAGGLGAGLLAFAGARLQSGIDIVMQATELRQHLKSADLVITAEGRIDAQTVCGKTPAGVARLAAEFALPVVAIGGGLADDARLVFAHGIHAIEAAVARDMSLPEALGSATHNLSNAAERVMCLLMTGKRLAG